MYRSSFVAIVCLSAGLTLGCEKKEPAPAAPSTDAAEKVMNDAAAKTADAQKAAAEKLEAAAQAKADAEKAAAEKAAAAELAATEKAAADKLAAAEKDAKDKAAAQAAELKQAAETTVQAGTQEEMVNKALPMIEEAMNYIKENKLDLAEKTLEQLDKIKGSLPEAIQTQIASAHQALDLAKASDSVSGMKLPGQ